MPKFQRSVSGGDRVGNRDSLRWVAATGEQHKIRVAPDLRFPSMSPSADLRGKGLVSWRTALIRSTLEGQKGLP